jgi:hypothetical protein
MRRLLISSLLAGAALVAVPSVGAAAVLADAPPAPPAAPSLPVCLTADVAGLDLNQLCKEPGPN